MKYLLFGCGAACIVIFTSCMRQPASDVYDAYLHENEEIGEVRQIYDGAVPADLRVNTFRNIHRLFPVRLVEASKEPLLLKVAASRLQEFVLSFEGQTWELSDYFEANHVTGMLVLKNREIVFEEYLHGNNRNTKWMSMSVVKSILATLVGVAIHDGFIGDIDDFITRYLPELRETAYAEVTVRQLLQMTSGVAWNETYTDPSSDRRAMLEAQIAKKPNAIIEVMSKLEQAAQPGTLWNYSTGETQVVAALLQAAIAKPLSEYLSEKIWQPYGMEADASWWLEAENGTEIGGSGLSATLRDYARFGLYMLDEGKINGVDTLPSDWVRQATQAQQINGKEIDYAYMWWPLEDDAYAAIGIYGQYIYIHPQSNIVIVLWSAQPAPVGSEAFDNLSVFSQMAEYLK